MGVGDCGFPVFGVDEAVDVFHWAGAVEGDHCGDVAEAGGFEFLDVTLHSGAFQLEQVGGVAGGEQVKGVLVVQRQGLQVDFVAAAFADQLDGLVEDG